MIKRRKSNSKLKVLILLLVIAIGYALISATLKINGNLFVKNNNWNIHWVQNSVNVVDGSVETENEPSVVDAQTVEFSAYLDSAGKYYEFTVDAKNDGTVAGLISVASIDAYQTDGETKINDEDLPGYIKKEITLANNKPIENHILKPSQTDKFRVRIEYTNNIDEDDLGDFSCIFKVNVEYVQKEIAGANATLVLNTDESQKGLIGVAYLDPTDLSVECNADSELEEKAIYPATSWPEIDHFDYGDQWDAASFPNANKVYYGSTEKYATSNGGCMKFYVFKDLGDSYRMILDHNTTSSVKPFPIASYVSNYKTKAGLTVWDEPDENEGSYHGNPWYYYTPTKCHENNSSYSDYLNCIFIGDDMLERDTEDWNVDDIDLITPREIAEIFGRVDEFDEAVTEWKDAIPENANDFGASFISFDFSSGLNIGDYDWLIDKVGITGNNNLCSKDTENCLSPGYWTKYVDYGQYSPADDPMENIGNYAIFNYYLIGIYMSENPVITRFIMFKEEDSIDVGGIRPVITVDKSNFKVS